MTTLKVEVVIMSNKKNALLHLLACILLIVLGIFSKRANVGMPVLYFILAGLMGFLALLYMSKKDEF
ncbi:MAG: hypothetical protein KBT48_09770 [Firmicutes bacterium]|nr:hypothetical protein [Bacillota bacterium]